MQTPVCPIADAPVATDPRPARFATVSPPAGGGRLDDGLRITGRAHHRRRPVELRANPSVFDQMLVVAALLSQLSTGPWLPAEPHHCN